ncbi:MAG TPA: NADH:flavin oxidoreductase/NADH oxidase [Pseudonocardiaceae bacterium]|jgi:2,4-dienoyl-CoA reductase-like NADH-dependent reductase (Old Yellow Enzyme family)|nr:NADH:flavin oxidoreductase/NADH oxidase [Pseudonocardiaceae bacterium]
MTVRGLTVSNRVWVSPMCQYSATDGLPNDWHLVHLGQFATGGAGLVTTEATAVTPAARISPQDTGIWNDEQVTGWRRITDFLHTQGTPVAIQLAHAGRKASTLAPWKGRGTVPVEDGGWQSVGPSEQPFGDYAAPRRLTESEVAEIPGQFAQAARRSVRAGFDAIELHFAHGYLVHQFLSPLSNDRDDRYGGEFGNRVRLALEIAEAVRSTVGQDFPVFVRISGTDWTEGGWTIEESVELATLLGERGIDLIDTSSGGNVTNPRIPLGPGYQVPLAAQVRKESGLLTGAVGMITEAEQAEEIIASGAADVVFLARAMLRDPHWTQHAAETLGGKAYWPDQYLRAAN